MGDLNVEHVTKRYGNVVAVNDMNLNIQDGEFISLIGPSGCGKSTTLETIAGLTKPTEGTITIANRDVTTEPPKDRNIAMVFQNIALFPHMDVFDNISFGLRIKNYDNDIIEKKVDHAADILELDGMLDRMPEELSGGQRQRVAIGRAIVLDPEVFLMDEPLANLDAKLRVHMRTELQRLHQKLEATIVYVTHDQAEAMTMSDRIAVINEGELQQIASPLECYNNPANLFVAGFIGSPSMHFLEGTIESGTLRTSKFELDIDTKQIDESAATDSVLFGIRPEDLYIAGSSLVEQTSEPVSLTVDVIQPMGDQILVYLLTDENNQGVSIEDDESQINTNQLLMSVGSETDLDPGQSIDVVADLSKIHLFDYASGEAVAHGVDSPAIAQGDR